jgi:hypothetical protein
MRVSVQYTRRDDPIADSVLANFGAALAELSRVTADAVALPKPW